MSFKSVKLSKMFVLGKKVESCLNVIGILDAADYVEPNVIEKTREQMFGTKKAMQDIELK